jgi:hypothetical protein
MTPDPARLFFIHIMKTGGTTFLYNLRAQFAPDEVYPGPADDHDPVTAYVEMPYLFAVPPERLASIRAFSGHFPYTVVQQLPGEFVTLTILREPVERTISYLKQCRALDQFRGCSLEEIYEDPWQRAIAISNYQTKVFAMTPDDPVHSIMDGLEIDERRLAIAKANLAAVDIVGLNDRYDEFLAAVTRHFGWTSFPVPDQRVSQPTPVPRSLARRIADDNPFELEFYEYARDLHARRAA